MPFGEHFRELRRRLTYIAIAVIGWSIVAGLVEHQIVALLLRPSNGARFMYTSPLGGINFLFNICIYTGFALSIPVIVYQFLRYIEPLMQAHSARFIRLGSIASGILAVAGMLFGYFIGLPAALQFLLNQSVNSQIRAQLTIESYLSFVGFYMLGAALMFQVPLIILFINRVTPLSPRQLLRHERWAILFAVVLAMVMNPTPNLFDQLFVAGPIVLTYQIGIVIVWWQSRTPRKMRQLQMLRAEDAKLQAERSSHARHLQYVWQPAVTQSVGTKMKPINPAQIQPGYHTNPPAQSAHSGRPRQYLDMFTSGRSTTRRFSTRPLPS